MATKSEQVRYARERIHPSKSELKPKRSNRSGEPGEHFNKHAANKANHTLEPRSDDGRASRKSSRRGSNHLKSDQGFIAKQNVIKSSPQSAHARAAARTSNRPH